MVHLYQNLLIGVRMTQLTSPARERQVRFLFAMVHFSKFLLPVLFGGLAFCRLTNERGMK